VTWDGNVESVSRGSRVSTLAPTMTASTQARKKLDVPPRERNRDANPQRQPLLGKPAPVFPFHNFSKSGNLTEFELTQHHSTQ
jgi:hypothetical protein